MWSIKCKVWVRLTRSIFVFIIIFSYPGNVDGKYRARARARFLVHAQITFPWGWQLRRKPVEAKMCALHL